MTAILESSLLYGEVLGQMGHWTFFAVDSKLLQSRKASAGGSQRGRLRAGIRRPEDYEPVQR